MVTSSMTATTFLKGYLEFLQRDGWRVTLVCSDGPGISELVARSGIDFEPLAMEREPSPLKDLRALIGAIKVLRQVRPEVLVYATPKASLLGSIAGALVRVPRRVYELWGLRLETATGLPRWLFTVLEATTARLSTVEVANSRSLAERAWELRVTGGRRIAVLGSGSSHGVDTERFRPASVEAELALSAEGGVSHPPVIGFIGRMHPDKGLDTLLSATSLLARSGRAFRLLLVGGEEGAGADPRIHELSRSMRVSLLGHRDDVRPALASMDVLILPSRREGFPNVVLEAAAMGVPAIVSDATGCRDAVVDGETGIVVPVNDDRALAQAIDTLLADARLRQSLGSAARKRVLDHFRSEKVWKEHSSFWAGTD